MIKFAYPLSWRKINRTHRLPATVAPHKIILKAKMARFLRADPINGSSDGGVLFVQFKSKSSDRPGFDILIRCSSCEIHLFGLNRAVVQNSLIVGCQNSIERSSIPAYVSPHPVVFQSCENGKDFVSVSRSAIVRHDWTLFYEWPITITTIGIRGRNRTGHSQVAIVRFRTVRRIDRYLTVSVPVILVWVVDKKLPGDKTCDSNQT